MTDSPPIACSLGADDLRRRLEEIAALGAEGLRGRSVEGNARILRFRPDPAIRRRLEEVVAAESECCAFLDLGLAEEDGDLVLRIAAPADGRPVADELALAFGEPRRC
ncbi:MAG TPA: hypothetical protein VHZ54_19625 [Solirubrobacterales bacterium]|jgi:hypothetical protein|nr:hypothetical protein [Solirubrobacterales bacterium]